MLILNFPFRYKFLEVELRGWALSICEKNPEISVVAKVEFPIGKKLFHLVSTPVRGRVPVGGPGTGTNYEKRK